jgi:purine-binding chemotaxis protein CheW
MLPLSQDIKGVVFRIEQEEYIIPIYQVVSIERMQPCTRLPKMPRHMKGVLDLRGSVIPVVDLREALGMKDFEDNENTRIIVVNATDESIGLIVDAATDVVDVPQDSVQHPNVALNVTHSFLKGICQIDKRLLILLDVDHLLNDVTSIESLKEVKMKMLQDISPL